MRTLSTRSFPGKVEASKSVELAFQVPGLLVKLPVREGQNVAKGDTDRPAAAGRIPGPTQVPARPTRSGSGDPRAHCGRANGPRSACAAKRRCGRPRRDSPTPGRNSIAPRGCSRSKAISRAEYERAETAYRVAQEDHQAALQVAREGHHRPRGGHRGPGGRRSAGSKAASSKPTSNSQDSTLRRPLRRRDRSAVRRAGAKHPGQGAGRHGFRTSRRSTSPSTCRKR